MSVSTIMRTTCMVLGALAIGACDLRSNEFEERDDRVADALRDNDEVGSFGNKAVWLIVADSVVPNDRVAAFFGTVDNFEACTIVAAALEERENRQYRCDTID